MIAFLEKHDHARWAGFFRHALQHFENQEYELCARKILSGSGGMGSLNDVYFEPRTIEREYGELLGRLYGFAHAIEKARTRK